MKREEYINSEGKRILRTTFEDRSAKSSLSASACSTYTPEMVVIRKDWIYAAQSAIESGIESALEELRVHERDLGRTTPKNKRAAENMEREIQKMRTAKNQLNDFTFSHHLKS